MPSVRAKPRARSASAPGVRMSTARGVTDMRISSGPSSARWSWRSAASAPSTAITARLTTVIGPSVGPALGPQPLWHHGGMRVHNFGAGPCALPLEVLEEVSSEFPEYRDTGMTVIEMSHRSADYDEIHQGAKDLARRVSGAPAEFDILFIQGGATLQFGMVPMNLLGDGDAAGYVVSGSWGKKALADGKLFGGYSAWDGADSGYTTMPAPGEVGLRPGSRYLHVTSNETIGGIRMVDPPATDVPLVNDMSSDYLARPIAWDRHAVVYGGGQENLAPAGMALVFIRRSVVGERGDLAGYLRYSTHVEGDSLANTPPM